jgi:hypothetical protein
MDNAIIKWVRSTADGCAHRSRDDERLRSPHRRRRHHRRATLLRRASVGLSGLPAAQRVRVVKEKRGLAALSIPMSLPRMSMDTGAKERRASFLAFPLPSVLRKGLSMMPAVGFSAREWLEASVTPHGRVLARAAGGWMDAAQRRRARGPSVDLVVPASGGSSGWTMGPDPSPLASAFAMPFSARNVCAPCSPRKRASAVCVADRIGARSANAC